MSPPLLQSFTLEELAKATGAKALRGHADLCFEDFVTDSREATRDRLFVALIGERFDGHDFVEGALERGCAGVVVSNPETFDALPEGIVGLLVEDTLQALGGLARAIIQRRSAHRAPFEIYAVTGSNGKTTTKEMLASLLEQRGSVLKTQGNFNNEIGLPLTVFGLTLAHRYAVLEMGANHLGEIARLVNIAPPDVALLTSLAPAHLEGFGSFEGVVKAKGEIFGRPETQRIAIPASLLHHYPSLQGDPRVVSVGAPGAALEVTLCGSDSEGIRARYSQQDQEKTLKVPLLGAHNAQNYGLALAATQALDHPETLSPALAQLSLPSGRLQTLAYGDEITLVQDAYNANPSSVRAAVEVLTSLAPKEKRVAILGEMRELGEESANLHREVGEAVAQSGLRALIAVGGPDAVAMAEGAKSAGLEALTFEIDQDQEVAEWLESHLLPKDVVLFKGSRGVALERVVQRLID